jgi:hypothetical protein
MSLPRRYPTQAEKFDEPFTTEWHRLQSEDSWIGGSYTMVPYYLSRLQGTNYYKLSKEELDLAVKRYVAQQYSDEVAVLCDGRLLWNIAAIVLRHQFCVENDKPSPYKPKEIAAYHAFLKDPYATNAQLAKRVNTTEKQLHRLAGWIAQARNDLARMNQQK